MLQINKRHSRFVLYYLLIILFFIGFTPECHAFHQSENKNILIADKSESKQNNQLIDAHNYDTSYSPKPTKSGPNFIQKIISFIKSHPPTIIYIIAFLIPLIVYLQRKNKS
jgi:hypothetical protein